MHRFCSTLALLSVTATLATACSAPPIGVTPTSPATILGASPTPASSATLSGTVWADYCGMVGGEGGVPATPVGSCVQDAAGAYVADGVQTPDEKGLAGVVVTLTPGQCPGDATHATTVATDANGAYRFANLAAGDYCVSVDALQAPNAELLIPGGWTFPAANVSSTTVTLAAGTEQIAINFGWDAQFD